MAKKRTVGEHLDTPAKRARARLRRLSTGLETGRNKSADKEGGPSEVSAGATSDVQMPSVGREVTASERAR
jgi:hypothetical protein